jgi:hypothetical protein
MNIEAQLVEIWGHGHADRAANSARRGAQAHCYTSSLVVRIPLEGRVAGESTHPRKGAGLPRTTGSHDRSRRVWSSHSGAFCLGLESGARSLGPAGWLGPGAQQPHLGIAAASLEQLAQQGGNRSLSSQHEHPDSVWQGGRACIAPPTDGAPSIAWTAMQRIRMSLVNRFGTIAPAHAIGTARAPLSIALIRIAPFDARW